MNALVNKFPTKLKIDEIEYEINTNFRICLDIILAFEDEELTGYEKIAIMLDLL